MKTQKGRCLCGRIYFETTGEPNSVSTCHCRSCQRASGGDSVAWAEFPIGKVSWRGAARAVHSSSPGVQRTFCPECGSSLSYQNEENSIDLVLACFDKPELFKPTKEIWLDHRLSWNARNKEIPGYGQFSSNELTAD